jgi:hypothetical protein
MTAYCCENCPHRQTVESDDLAMEIDKIETWCQSSGVSPALGNCLKLQDAATYLGRSEKTLQNWLYIADSPLEVRRLRRRSYVTINSVAAFVIAEK